MYVQVECYRNIYWNYAANNFLLPHIRLFWKTKRVLELVFLAHFLHEFWRKYFIIWFSLLLEILEVFVSQVVASQISKLRLAFLSSLFTTWPKFSKCKCKITKMSLSLKVNSAKKRQLLKTCHLRHRLRIFLFHRKVMFHSQDTQVYVFVTIPWFTKLVTSWWVLVHEAGCNFEYILWNTTHWVPNPGQLIEQ